MRQPDKHASYQLASAAKLTHLDDSSVDYVFTDPPFGSNIFYALLLPGLFGIVFAAGSRTRTARLLSLIVVLGFSTLRRHPQIEFGSGR